MSEPGKQLTAVEAIRQQLTTPAMTQQIKMALPSHVSVDRFIRMTMSYINGPTGPDILKCDRKSLFASILTAASVGLAPDAALGESYLVPFKQQAQLIIGWRGLLKLARQSGDIGAIEVDVICSNDKVKLEGGDRSLFTIDIDWQDRGEVVGAYAIAKDKEGRLYARVVLTKSEIDKVRAAAPSKNSPAWRDWYEEMAKKTAIRRLAKLLPLTAEAARAVRLSDVQDDLGKHAAVDAGGQIIEGEATESAPEPTSRRKKPDQLEQLAQDAKDRAGAQSPGVQQTFLDPPPAGEGALNVDPTTGEVIG